MSNEILIQFRPDMFRLAVCGLKDLTRRTSARWAKVEPGDVLIARCRWRTLAEHDGVRPIELPDGAPIHLAADSASDHRRLGKWRPAMFLPRRFWGGLPRFGVVDVRRERLGDITDADAMREGIRCACRSPRDLFFELWREINGEPDLDQVVWRIEFKKTTPLEEAPKNVE